MFTRYDLYEADYKTFNETFKKCNAAYQKRVGNTRYFINIYEYYFPQMDNKFLFYAECQFEDQDGVAINVGFNTNDLTLEQVEAKIESIFVKLNCKDYE